MLHCSISAESPREIFDPTPCLDDTHSAGFSSPDLYVTMLAGPDGAATRRRKRVMSSNSPGSIDTHVGRQLKARRQQLNLKQADLAKALQVSIQQIHKYETAKNALPAAKLFTLSRALGVEPAYFFSGLEGEVAANAPIQARKPALR